MADANKKNEFHGYDRGASFKAARLVAVANLPRPTANVGEKQIVKHGAPTTLEDKLSTLRSYRRARGLNDVCAEKWFCGHKCAPTIPLQAMQEVWNLFQIDEFSDNAKAEQETPGESAEQLFLALSCDAVRGSRGQQII